VGFWGKSKTKDGIEAQLRGGGGGGGLRGSLLVQGVGNVRNKKSEKLFLHMKFKEEGRRPTEGAS